MRNLMRPFLCVLVVICTLRCLLARVDTQLNGLGFSESAAEVLRFGSDDDKLRFAFAIPVEQKLSSKDIKVFEGALGTCSDSVRVLLCNVILRTDNENQLAVEGLLRLSRTGNEWVRVQIGCALQNCRQSDATVECARALIKDRSPAVRTQLLISVVYHRQDWAKLAEELVFVMRHEEDLNVKMWCLNAIARLNPRMSGKDLDIVHECLDSHSPWVRAAAVRAIQKVDAKSQRSANKLLLLLAGDKDGDVRLEIARGMANLNIDSRAVKVLVQCLQKEDVKLTKLCIVRSIATRKTEALAAVEELKMLCEDSYFEAECLVALWAIGGHKADVLDFFNKRLALATSRGDQGIVELIRKTIPSKPSGK